jgi:hypothetical protein
MSEIHDIIGEVVAGRAPWTSDPVRNLRTGAWFTAEIDGSPDAVLVMTELGEDAREIVMLNVTSDEQAAGIQSQDRVEFTLFGKKSQVQIIKRRQNPATVQAQFWAQYIVPGVDS